MTEVPTQGRKHRVALIMPARNEERSAAATLAAVFASTRLPDEIVIADGRSSDRTLEVIRGFEGRGIPIRIVDNPEIFAGAGRNRSVAASTAEILLFLDFGNIVEPEWIAAMIEPFERDAAIDAVGGMFVPDATTDYERCVAAIQYLEPTLAAKLTLEQKLARAPSEHRLGGLGTAVSRACWDRVGGQPAWLRAGEDLLFGRKLLALNARITGAPGALLRHHMRGSPGAVFRQNFVYSRGHGRTDSAHPYYRRLFFIYGGAVASAIAATWSWPAGVPGALLLLAHLAGAGYRRLMVAYGTMPTMTQFAFVPLVLFPRDAGIFCGYLAGLLDWIREPRFRQSFADYMSLR